MRSRSHGVRFAVLAIILSMVALAAVTAVTTTAGGPLDVPTETHPLARLRVLQRRRQFVSLIRSADLIVLGRASQVDSRTIDTSWGNAIDVYGMRCYLLGQCMGEDVNPSLGRTIGSPSCRAFPPPNRPYVDNLARLLLDHMGKHVLAAEELTFEIDRQHTMGAVG